MQNSNERVATSWRVLLAALAIGGVLAVAGRSLAPHTPTGTWLFWCAIAGGALVVAVAACLVIGLQVRQAVLRKGGTDAQWFAFSSEPEGLVSLRGQAWANPKHEVPTGVPSTGGRHVR